MKKYKITRRRATISIRGSFYRIGSTIELTDEEAEELQERLGLETLTPPTPLEQARELLSEGSYHDRLRFLGDQGVELPDRRGETVEAALKALIEGDS